MKPTESTPPTTTSSRKSVISFRETFFIPLLRLYLIFFLLFCFLFCLGYYERECMCEITLSRDDAEAQSVASLAHSHDYALKYLYTGKATEQSDVYGFGAVQLDSHDDAETPWVALPSPRHYIITSFDPPLFVLDGLLFSYYCLIGLSLYLSVQILKIFMKPTLKTLVISLKNKCIISVWSKFQSGKNRETFFIPLLRLCLIFCLLFCLGYFLPSDPRDVVLSGYLCYMVITTLKKLIYLALIYLENRGDPFKHLKRERITESLPSRDDAEAQSLAFLAHISVHMGILLLLLSLPSPRHFITSFDPPLFVLDGLLFSYYCLIGLSLHLSVQILKKIMKPMLNTLAISLKNKGIISVSSKFESGKNREQKPLVEFDSTNNREQKPLVEFDSTNNRAYRSSLLVEDFYEDFFRASTARSAEKKRRDEEKRSCLNSLFGNAVLVESDKTNVREASKGPCMTEGVPSLVDSTTRISSTDFDAPDNSAHLVRAIQSGPIMLNSEKNDTSEGLIREGLTESVLSLDDSTKRKSFPDFDAAENKAHLVRPYQSGPVVSLSKNKNEGEALKKDLQQHCGGRSDAAAKSFRAISDPGLYTTDSLTWKSFEVLETLRPREQQSNATDTDQERQIQTQMCDELPDARGGRPDAAAKSFHAVYDPGFHTPYSVARKSFEVLETLPARKQPTDGVPLLLPGRLTLEGCVQQEKSPDLPRVMQFNGVEQRVTKMPRYLGGLTAQSASSSCGPIGLPNGGHIVLLDELDQSTKNIEHVATADQCSPTLSLPEKKMVRKTLNRNCRTMSVIFEEKHQRFVRRCEGATKSLGAMCISRKHGINQVSMVEPIHKQRGIHQWPFLRSAVGLPDGGHILSLLEKKIVRKTLKRKCRSMSVLSLKDHKQHVDRRWEDATKSHGAKCIRRQLVIHRLSTAKRTHKKHGIHPWPFQRPAISLPDRGHILSISEKKIVRKTLKRKCRSMSVLSLVDRQQHVDKRWEDAAKNIGAKRICRQLVIHRVSIAKRICRQHGIHHRWPFEQDWATEKGYSLGDEILVEVISLSTHAELVSRLQLIYISWLGRFSPRPSALPRGGLIAGPIAFSSSEFAATNNIAQRVRQDQRGFGASGSEKKRTREQNPKEKPKSITIDDLLPYQGKKTREETAAILHVSRSTVYRTWSKSGCGTWKNGGKNKVLRPPDQHGERNTSTTRETPSHNVQTGIEGVPVGQNQEANEFRPDFTEGSIPSNTENGLIIGSSFGFPPPQITSMPISKPLDQDGERNTSTACETPSHNVQTGTEGELFGQNEVANVLRRDFMGGPNALDTESGLIMVSRPPDQHGERNTSTACETPSHNVENEMGSQNSKPNEFQPDSFEDLNLEEFLCDCDFLPLGEEPSLEGLVSGSVNLTLAACSDPATCQHPMPTNPDTMTTTHKMPCLAAEGDMRFVTLKLTYRKKIIKFQFPLMSGIIELKEEVKKRLKLELDSFDIEYKDEDGDCIFLGCDEDLRNHLQLFSNQVIRLLVVDSDANTANFR